MNSNFLIFLFSMGSLFHLNAQIKGTPSEVAGKIANRILSSTTYTFVDKENGQTYTTVKDLPLKKSVQVAYDFQGKKIR